MTTQSIFERTKTMTHIDKHEVVLDRQTMEEIWEVAFGDDAFEKGYTDDEVRRKLLEFSLKALAWDTLDEELQPVDDDPINDTELAYQLRNDMARILEWVTNN